MLDVAHHPGHLDAALDGKFTLGLHLPSSSRATPWAQLGETSTYDDLVEVDQALQVGQLFEDVRAFNGRELVGEIGSRGDRDLLVQSFRGVSVGDSEIGSIVQRNGFSQIGHSVDVESDAGHDFGDAGDPIHTTVEVCPNRLNLGNVEQEGVHETKDVESHLFGGECPHTELFETLGDKVGGAHETGTSSPTDNSSGDTEVFSPGFCTPSVEQCFEGNLGFRIETVVTKNTVVGRQGKDDLGGSSDKVSSGLFDLDSTKQSEQVGQHKSVGEFGLVVNVVDLSAIFRESGEWDHIVEIDVEGRVNVVNQSFGVLSRGSVEGDDNEF